MAPSDALCAVLDREALERLAAKYIWWQAADEAVAQRPRRVMAQVMNLADFDDMQALARQVGDGALRDVLAHAEAGWFEERAWAYWHCRLGVAALGRVPPLPQRQIPA